MKKHLILFLIIVCFLQVRGQIISGKIFDAQTKEAIPFASVYFDQTFVGASADQNGIFTLNVFKNSTMPLIVSAVGYYSVLISDYLDIGDLEIYLNPKAYEINEIAIQSKSLKRKKERYLLTFKREFIGTSKNAKECVILNEEDITFNYHSKSDTIKAYALKPILIENRALGYKITYYLDRFEYSSKSNYTYFSGSFIFSEDSTAYKDFISLYQNKRENAYNGSRAHFIRTLCTGSLEGTCFEITDASYNTLKIADIVFIDDIQQRFIQNVGKIIIYNRGRRSEVNLTGDPVYFDETGYFAANGIIWSGDMGNQRMADWLPYEYIPENLLNIAPVSAQSVDNYFESQTVSDFDKLYLSTDREFYFIGDTLWFSPYIVDAKTHYLSTNNCNLYVDLINNKGEIIEERNFLLNEGFCSGYLFLDNKVVYEGNYILRAYTDRIKLLGNNYFFKKTIKVNGVRPPSDQHDSIVDDTKRIVLEFYPEGGFLLEGAANQLAFVARDQNGKRIDFTGELQSSDGIHIKIETDYNGTGSILFVPNAEQKYTVVGENNVKLKYKMPEFRDQGAKLTLIDAANDAVRLSISASVELQTSNYYIAVFHRGVGLTYFKFNKVQISQPIILKENYFGMGINRLVLLNDNFEPLSERLIFVNKEGEDLLVNAKTDKKEYNTREQVNIDLSIPELAESEVWARISVAVVHENMTGVHGNLQNIKSYLLLDSELKGQIQTPGLYFIDDDSISSSQKLDLLMLTYGWRNYVWTDMKEKGSIEIPAASYGLVFDGNVKKTMSNKPFVGTNVFLNCNNKDFQKVEITKTDDAGYFRFDSILFTDSASIVLQAKNYNDKTNAQLDVNTFGMQHARVDDSEYKNIDDIGELSFESYKLKHLNELALSEFFPDRKSILIEDVEVIADKIEEKQDNHFRIYTPSESKKLTDITRSSYRNVFEYLNGAGRFAGVRVGIDKDNNDVIIIRGGEASLYLLDGFPVSPDELLDVPMCNVDVVDILKSPETAIFGMKGSGGIISVFTRDAEINEPENEIIPGTIVEKIKGFEQFRSFYNPVYDTNNVNSVIPDYRQTIYWNPAIILNGTSQSVSFFTCDNLSSYKVLIEGITNSGKICLGDSEFVVNKRK